ncbi:MAG TPA: nucleotidyltransferase domain-containing protein [Candidatus Nanoarchaeia archaeon]|nr:nucleotidyltransferase domain-containing protein [Candidatus Nanoarchaeia archaeon]
MLKTKKISGTEIPKLERAYDKVHAWFFAYPQEEFSLNDVCKATDISKTTANLVVSELEKDGFLKISIIGKLWRIKSNPQHPYFKTRKIPFNLRLIYESPILDVIKKSLPNAKCIVLFGSFRWGDDIKDSDLDIAVEVLDNKPLEIFEIIIKELGYRQNIKANIHVFSRNKIDLNLFANIANGIVLDGFLEVRP